MAGKAKLIVVSALVAAMLALAGCSSGAASTSASSANSNSSSASVSAASASSAGVSAASSSAAVQPASSSAAAALANGVYEVTFDTDSSMFHVNEADSGKGVLTVSDDGMVVHVRLASKKIVNLYAGKADEAQANGAALIEPTTDTVTYSDGYTEEVYGFDVPVPALDEEFDVAILGEKGTWYDHVVSVSDPVAVTQ